MISCLDCSFNCINSVLHSDDEKNQLFQAKRDIQYKKGESIIKQNTFISHLFYVRTGLVKFEIEGHNDKNIILNIIPAGNLIGYSVIKNYDYYPYSIIALKNSDICMIKKEVVLDLLSKNQHLVDYFFRLFIEDYRFMFEKFSTLGTKQMHGKFADTILFLSQPEFLKEEIFQHLTRKDIADMAGMSMESLTKILNEFKSDKLITVQGKEIFIRDLEMMKRISRVG